MRHLDSDPFAGVLSMSTELTLVPSIVFLIFVKGVDSFLDPLNDLAWPRSDDTEEEGEELRWEERSESVSFDRWRRFLVLAFREADLWRRWFLLCCWVGECLGDWEWLPWDECRDLRELISFKRPFSVEEMRRTRSPVTGLSTNEIPSIGMSSFRAEELFGSGCLFGETELDL